MGKNVVVCCDGTANQVFAGDDTNVVRLCAVAVKDPAQQVVYYHPGLGTMAAQGALTWWGRFWTKVAGLAFGYGIANDIQNAYSFIMATYEPGDRLYLFGFSRGAYTARAVASLLKLYGLLRRGNESLVPYVVRELLHFDSFLWLMIDRTFGSKLNEKRAAAKFDKATEFRSVFATQSCKPHFVGVWDTVSSVGLSFNPTRVPYTARNKDIAIGRHALALDERRAFFNRNLWQRDPLASPIGPHDIKEVWFAGVHCDIGGGYPAADSDLARISFAWMVKEAAANHFLVDQIALNRVVGSSPNPNGKMHNSMTGLWFLAEFVPKATGINGEWRINLFRRRWVPSGALIHQSVLDRTGYHRPLPSNRRIEPY
jgi:uncharacterized protein (DUF2235 family)